MISREVNGCLEAFRGFDGYIFTVAVVVVAVLCGP